MIEHLHSNGNNSQTKIDGRSLKQHSLLNLRMLSVPVWASFQPWYLSSRQPISVTESELILLLLGYTRPWTNCGGRHSTEVALTLPILPSWVQISPHHNWLNMWTASNTNVSLPSRKCCNFLCQSYGSKERAVFIFELLVKAKCHLGNKMYYLGYILFGLWTRPWAKCGIFLGQCSGPLMKALYP